jgi:uridine monophosphate synthetase
LVVFCDREAGAREALQAQDVSLHSVCSLSKVLAVLQQQRNSPVPVPVHEMKKNTAHQLRGVTTLTFEDRAKHAAAVGSTNARLFEIMTEKQSNLCVSVDLQDKERVLELIEAVASKVAVVKLHLDVIRGGTNTDFLVALNKLAQDLNFVLLIDRKLGDIGNTSRLQKQVLGETALSTGGLVTAHALAGQGTLEGLLDISTHPDVGALLILQMSSPVNLLSKGYTSAALETAMRHDAKATASLSSGEGHGWAQVNGFISKGVLSVAANVLESTGAASKTAALLEYLSAAEKLHFSPGVQLPTPHTDTRPTDPTQTYRTPNIAINDDGADIIIVGRGIYSQADPAAAAEQYRLAAWEAYKTKVSHE